MKKKPPAKKKKPTPVYYSVQTYFHITSERSGITYQNVLTRETKFGTWQKAGVERVIITPCKRGIWGTGKVIFVAEGSRREYKTLAAALRERERVKKKKPK